MKAGGGKWNFTLRRPVATPQGDTQESGDGQESDGDATSQATVANDGAKQATSSQHAVAETAEYTALAAELEESTFEIALDEVSVDRTPDDSEEDDGEEEKVNAAPGDSDGEPDDDAVSDSGTTLARGDGSSFDKATREDSDVTPAKTADVIFSSPEYEELPDDFDPVQEAMKWIVAPCLETMERTNSVRQVTMPPLWDFFSEHICRKGTQVAPFVTASGFSGLNKEKSIPQDLHATVVINTRGQPEGDMIRNVFSSLEVSLGLIVFVLNHFILDTVVPDIKLFVRPGFFLVTSNAVRISDSFTNNYSVLTLRKQPSK